MSSLRWALRRYRKLSPRERRVLALASALVPLVHLTQQRLPFRRWRRLLESAGARLPRGAEAPTVREIAWAVEVARRWVPGTYRCLPAAYAAHILLRRYGYASEVHVGVRRDAQAKVEAHAWVVCQGQVVVGDVPDLSAFVPLPPLGSVGT